MKAKRENGSGSVRVRGGRYYIRYRHNGRLFEQKTDVLDDGTDTARRRALKVLAAKVKPTNTASFVEPRVARVTVDQCSTASCRSASAKRGRRTWGPSSPGYARRSGLASPSA